MNNFLPDIFKTYMINGTALAFSMINFEFIQNLIEWLLRVLLLIVTIWYTLRKIRERKKNRSDTNFDDD